MTVMPAKTSCTTRSGFASRGARLGSGVQGYWNRRSMRGRHGQAAVEAPNPGILAGELVVAHDPLVHGIPASAQEGEQYRCARQADAAELIIHNLANWSRPGAA